MPLGGKFPFPPLLHESRDFLSQHAPLSIESTDGFQVYVVSGSEIRRGSGGEERAGRSEGGSPRLGSSGDSSTRWKTSERLAGSRRAVDKVLTPPGFETRTQGHARFSTCGRRASNRSSSLTRSNSPRQPLLPNITHTISQKPLPLPHLQRARFDFRRRVSDACLIPSEDPCSRRRRPRPSSACLSRISHEAELPPPRRGGDRGQIADAFTNWDAWSPFGGTERPRGRSKSQSVGRGATSEDENERVSSRSQVRLQ